MQRRALFLAPQYDGTFAPHLPGSINVENGLREVLVAKGRYEFRALRKTIRRAEFNRHVRELVDTTGEVLLYFYGHGVLRGNAGLFVTSDGELDDEGVSMREVIETVFRSNAREVVVILDCCHAGAALGVEAETIEGIALSCIRAGRVLLAGCASHQQGWVEQAEQKKIGVFSWYILKGLNGDARQPRSSDVRASSLGTYVTDNFQAWNQSPFCIPRETGDQRCVITTGFQITDGLISVSEKPDVGRALVLGVPFRPSQLFVGRDAELETLRTRLTGGHRPVAVTASVEGLGGVGKTELVVQLLGDPEIVTSFATIVWLDGAGPLPPQWQKIGEELDLQLPALEATTLVDRISMSLNQRGRTLIILDNATEWRPVQHLLPTEMSLLVTTRTRDFGGTSFRHLELDILSDPSARLLLLQMVPRLEIDTGLQKLIATLGGHALAIEIAGGTINTLGISAAEYLARLDTRTPDPAHVISQVKHGKTVDECLKLTWDSLQSESARALWRRAALFAPASAHRELLRVSFTADPQTQRELRHLLEDGEYASDLQLSDLLYDDFDLAYAELRARNVFSRIEGINGERWAIHRLVRDFGRARIKSLEFLAHSMAISVWLRHPSLDLQPEIPHLIALLLDSAKYGGEFQSVLGGRRSLSRELSNRSASVLYSSSYFLDFIRDELRDPKALSMLLEGLTDINDDVRKQAIVVLESLPHIPEVIEGFAKALDDPDPRVRNLARKTIIESGTEKVIHVLEKTLGSSKPRAVLEAVRCLAKLGRNALPTLRAAFEKETGDTKFEAALGLAELGCDVGLSDLIPAAEASPNETVRVRALDATKYLPSEAVDALYLNAIRDSSEAIQERVLNSLKNYERANVVKECLIRYFDSVVSKVSAGKGSALSLALDIAQERHIPVSEQFASKILKHSSWEVRLGVARCLAWSENGNTAKLLAVLLGDSDYDVREAAVRSIAARGDVSLLMSVRQLSTSDPSEAVKKAAREAIQSIKSRYSKQ